MWKKLGLACFLLFALATPAAVAATPGALTPVREAFMAARLGLQPLDKALAIVDQYLETDPSNPVAIAYRGSIRTMMARESILPYRKLSYLKEGMDQLDDATSRLSEAQPFDGHDGKLEILMVSSTTNAKIPSMFGRRPMAERDFRKAIALPAFEKALPEEKAQAYAWLAVITADTNPEDSKRFLADAKQLDAPTADKIWNGR